MCAYIFLVTTLDGGIVRKRTVDVNSLKELLAGNSSLANRPGLFNLVAVLGVMDIFLDRRLTQDDGRGLGQGVMDNREIISTLKLLFERRYTVIYDACQK